MTFSTYRILTHQQHLHQPSLSVFCREYSNGAQVNKKEIQSKSIYIIYVINSKTGYSSFCSKMRKPNKKEKKKIVQCKISAKFSNNKINELQKQMNGILLKKTYVRNYKNDKRVNVLLFNIIKTDGLYETKKKS